MGMEKRTHQVDLLREKLDDELISLGVDDLDAMQRLLDYSLYNSNAIMNSSSNRLQSQIDDVSNNVTNSLDMVKHTNDMVLVPIIEYYHQLISSSSKPSSIILNDLCNICPALSSTEIEGAAYFDNGDSERRDILVSQKYEMTLSLLLYQRALLSSTCFTTELLEDLAMGCALHQSFCGYQSKWFIPVIRRLRSYVLEAALILTTMGQEEENSNDEHNGNTSSFIDSIGRMPFRMEQDDERNKENVMPKQQRRALPEIEFKKQRARKRERRGEQSSNSSSTPIIARLVVKETPTKKSIQDTRRILATPPPRRRLRL